MYAILYIGLNDFNICRAYDNTSAMPVKGRLLENSLLTVDSLLGPSNLLSETRTDCKPDPNLPQIRHLAFGEKASYQTQTVIKNTI